MLTGGQDNSILLYPPIPDRSLVDCIARLQVTAKVEATQLGT